MSDMERSWEKVTTPTGIKWKNGSGAWADEKIKSCPLRELDDFIVRRVRDHNCRIDPRKIAGTTYGDFVGKSWRQALSEKRMSVKLACLETNPEYYSDPKHYKTDDEAWGLYEICGFFYPVCGTHRSIVSKFRAHEEGYDSQLVWWVDRFTFSCEAKQAYTELKQLLLPCETLYAPHKVELKTNNEDINEYEIFASFWLHTWCGAKFYRMPVIEAGVPPSGGPV